MGDHSFDQMRKSGHSSRITDLDLVAGLGIRTLRYPLLWELTAPRCCGPTDWSWADERLERMAALSIRPIVGLVHHGSGPRYTSLTDPGFATGLARYAGEVAQRFPWVHMYTPVNEPLTTARFSGLYGLWYPHGRDNTTFARALVNQCRGTALAMQAIRRVNSNAALLQTDDLGRTAATPGMQYQADFDNERRWIAWDLLSGKVSRDHALHQFLIDSGIDAAELGWFLENPCPPDILGINHYVTSDRFLDERCERYSAQSIGSNGRDRYADVDAVRVVSRYQPGWRSLMDEAWQRYRTPLALSEVHLGCTREEQIRWFDEAWTATQDMRAAGVDVRAVTAWALFGSFNWNSLLTTDTGHYEPGAFDARGAEPRPTALASLLRGLSSGVSSRHPVLQSPGWWHRSERRIFAGGRRAPSGVAKPRTRKSGDEARPIVMCGGSDAAVGAIAAACDERGLEYCGLSSEQIDISDPEALARVLQITDPWAVINTASWVCAVEAQREAGIPDEENGLAPRALAVATSRRAIPLLTFSSLTRSNATAELAVLKLNPRGLFAQLAASTPDLIHVSLDLLIDGECGLWHISADRMGRAIELSRRPTADSPIDLRRSHRR